MEKPDDALINEAKQLLFTQNIPANKIRVEHPELGIALNWLAQKSEVAGSGPIAVVRHDDSFSFIS